VTTLPAVADGVTAGVVRIWRHGLDLEAARAPSLASNDYRRAGRQRDGESEVVSVGSSGSLSICPTARERILGLAGWTDAGACTRLWPVARTVLIIDDDPSFREAARMVLAARVCRVVGEAGGALQGLALVRQMRPDAVLLDVNLPDGDGIAVAERLSATGGCRVVLTSSDATAAPDRLVRSSGAAGFVAKENLAGPALKAYLAG